MNFLEQLKTLTKVVADSSDIESIRKFKPLDATTNPSLIYTASQETVYASLINEAVFFAKQRSSNKQKQLEDAMDKLFVNFGAEILKFIPGRVSTEVDARLSFDIDVTIIRAKKIISFYQEVGIDREKVLIKVASTWEGIKAAQILAREGIRCNMTLLFSLPQAVACAEAGVQLISPFVGRVLDWFKKNDTNQYLPNQEPGVVLVKNIFNYFKKYEYSTEIMAASFRNSAEIIELAGCDLMTIAPSFLKELEGMEGILEKKLDAEEAKKSSIAKLNLDEKQFRWLMNQDAMALEKLAEGIRKFAEDLIKLETIIMLKL